MNNWCDDCGAIVKAGWEQKHVDWHEHLENRDLILESKISSVDTKVVILDSKLKMEKYEGLARQRR